MGQIWSKMQNSRRQHNRKKLWLKFDKKCAYCDKSITFKQMTLDHVVPRSRGGRGLERNRLPCCHKCNQLKGDKTYEEFVITTKS